MSLAQGTALLLLGSLLAGAVLVWVALRARNMQTWIGSYVFPAERRGKWERDVPTDVFIAICDHYEPQGHGAAPERAEEKVRYWVEQYPKLFDQFRDVDGQPPRHTFFFPQDEYHPAYLDLLKQLCDAGYADVEVHLHHDHDSAQGLREKLAEFRDVLFHRHGLLRTDENGDVTYGFIHGNWALCNSRPDGRWCGVDEELTVLRETGCYADFTLPAAPSPAQTRTINSIYYARDLPGRRKSHDTGIRARVGQPPPHDHLLMIQGPLGLDWTFRRWGLVPRTENGDVHGRWPASIHRFWNWLNLGVCVAGRPQWRFIKLHAHGCKEANIPTLLGPAMQQFHADLAAVSRCRRDLRVHYVTAWEMAQLVHQAERGFSIPDLRAIRETVPRGMASPSLASLTQV